MDSKFKEKRYRELNPWDRANYLSKILFIFAAKTFQKGFKADFVENDIYDTLKNGAATNLGDRLERQWKIELTKKRSSLVRALARVYGKRLIFLGIVYFFLNTTMLILTPMLKGKFVSYFTPGQTNISDPEAYTFCLVLLICTFLNVTFQHWYMFSLERLTFKMKTSLSILLYRKLLSVNNVSTSSVANGQFVTLITKDINSFDYMVFLVNKLWIGIIQIFTMIYLMYNQIGAAALVGSASLLVAIPFQALVGKFVGKFRKKTAEKTDERIKITQEILTAIKVIKMYTWELFYGKNLSNIRKKEIRNLRILIYLRALIMSSGQLNAKFSLYACIITYVSLGNHITAQKAFTVIGYFTVLHMVISIFIPYSIFRVADLKIALDRISNFLMLEEVKDNKKYLSSGDSNIWITDCTVECQQTTILKDISLNVRRGLTLIAGSIGSGKSTILKLILGEVERSKGQVRIPRCMSYASQEPWLFPGTIRQNIIFNEKYDPHRYEQVLRVCALQKDLDELPNRDETVIVDKGLNLSRGQATRVNLARAIYRNADVYLLDDSLASVDSNVKKQIFQQCIKKFLTGKICILVTNYGHFFESADNIVVMKLGQIVFQGNYNSFKELQDSSVTFDDNAEEEKKSVAVKNLNCNNDEEINEKDIDDSVRLLTSIDKMKEGNIYAETSEIGRVKKEVYKTYFKSGGGFRTAIWFFIFAIASQIFDSSSDYFLSYWVDMERDISGFISNHTTNSTEYENYKSNYNTVMWLYTVVIFATVATLLLRVFFFYRFSCKAAIRIHNSIISQIMGATMDFFDINLTGNIINRLSRDISIIDEQLPFHTQECVRIILYICGTLFIIASIHYGFIFMSIFFLCLLLYARYLYIPTARSVRRLEGSSRSPVIGHINATLDGLTTIRASEAKQVLAREFDHHYDHYNSCVHTNMFTSRAFAFYLDMLAFIFVALIMVSFLIFQLDVLAGKVGLAITKAFSLTGTLQWMVRQTADFENHMTSMERLHDYNKIDQEKTSGNHPDNWPSIGAITYSNVNLRYSKTGEYVLKDVSFRIEAKQKVGIVGRTGAGKSSIISALFRLYDFEGSVLVDEIDNKSLSINHLRSKLSIIPQDPVLFTGTIRSNLDPHNKCSDKDLWRAIEEVKMKDSVVNLNATTGEGGLSFSVGQKQLLCLARAIVQNNNVLVLDEATANIDPETDDLIQEIIRCKFVDCTVITIAHKISTIMDSDRILLIDSGKLIEFDNPKILLTNKESKFYRLAEETGFLKR